MTAYVSGDFCSVFCTNNSLSMCQVILNIQRVVVKGYHECPFSVEVGERFVAQKKIRDLFISVGSTVIEVAQVQLMMLKQDGVLQEG